MDSDKMPEKLLASSGGSNSLKELIYIEIIKRHVEEYDPECISLLKNIKNDFIEIIPEIADDESIFYRIIHFAIMIYTNYKKGFLEIDKLSNATKIIEQTYPILLEFQNNKIIKLYDQLRNISDKYNIYATDILYPIKMDCIFDFYPKQRPVLIDVIRFHPSNVTKSEKFKLYPSKKNQNAIIIKLLKNEFVEDDIDLIKREFILLRCRQGKELTNLDLEFYKNCSKKYTIDTFRSDSFVKRILGLFAWDLKKGYQSKYKTPLQLYKHYRLQDDKKKISCENICEGRDGRGGNNNCTNIDTCNSFVDEGYSITRNSISDKKNVHVKTHADSNKEPKGDMLVDRYHPSIYTWDGEISE